MNHLGVEVDGTAEVRDSIARLQQEGLATLEELDTVCCYAQQDKVWVNDPAGAPWEVYTITDDNPDAPVLSGDGACCTPAPELITIGSPEQAGKCC